MSLKNYFKKSINTLTRDFTSFGNPIILLIISLMVLGFDYNFLFIIFGLILIEIICSIIKLVYYKERPNKEEHTNLLEKIDAGSFPSVHSARSSFVFLTLFLLSNVYLNKIIFIILLLIVGCTRILLKKHFTFDIIIGYLIGISMVLLRTLI